MPPTDTFIIKLKKGSYQAQYTSPWRSCRLKKAVQRLRAPFTFSSDSKLQIISKASLQSISLIWNKKLENITQLKNNCILKMHNCVDVFYRQKLGHTYFNELIFVYISISTLPSHRLKIYEFNIKDKKLSDVLRMRISYFSEQSGIKIHNKHEKYSPLAWVLVVTLSRTDIQGKSAWNSSFHQIQETLHMFLQALQLFPRTSVW